MLIIYIMVAQVDHLDVYPYKNKGHVPSNAESRPQDGITKILV